MPGPNKEDVTGFVLGSSQGSQVILSEVEVTEASLQSDSLPGGGGHEGEWLGSRSIKETHFKQQDSQTLTLHGGSSRFHVVVAEVSARPLNHYVTLVNSTKSHETLSMHQRCLND